MDFEIPEALRSRALRHGSTAMAWLDDLESDVTSFAAEYRLELICQLRLGRELAIGFLVRLDDGRSAVLRAAQDRDVVQRQGLVLKLWSDRPAVDVLAIDADRRILLIEALDPERDLHSVDVNRAATIACGVLTQLWIPAPHTGVLPRALPSNWRPVTETAGHTLAVAGRSALARRRHAIDLPVVLHGDLHRGNVLAGQGERWVAIDPLPAIGPPAIDLAILASDLVAEDVGTSRAGRRLASLVDDMVTAVPGHGVRALAVLDCMLLHRLEQINVARLEARDDAWDIEFANLLASSIR